MEQAVSWGGDLSVSGGMQGEDSQATEETLHEGVEPEGLIGSVSL